MYLFLCTCGDGEAPIDVAATAVAAEKEPEAEASPSPSPADAVGSDGLVVDGERPSSKTLEGAAYSYIYTYTYIGASRLDPSGRYVRPGLHCTSLYSNRYFPVFWHTCIHIYIYIYMAVSILF